MIQKRDSRIGDFDFELARSVQISLRFVIDLTGYSHNGEIAPLFVLAKSGGDKCCGDDSDIREEIAVDLKSNLLCEVSTLRVTILDRLTYHWQAQEVGILHVLGRMKNALPDVI